MPSVQILCPPASFLTGSVSTALTGNIDRAFRRTGMLGTLDGAFISLVPSSTYVWFASTSSFGIHGVDPATHTSNLGTGYRCILSGNLGADQVAEHLRYTVSLIPNFSASRINSTATITSSNIFYTASHAGTSWNNRGYADMWGLRQRSSTGNNGNTNAVVAQSAPVPNVSGTRLRGIRVGRTVAAGALRASVYYAQGGSSETDPTNATLLYDFGQTLGNITEGYEYLYVISSTYPIIPQTGVIWLAFKGDGGQGNNLYQLQGVTNTDNSNFYQQNTFISTAGSSPVVPFSQSFGYAGSNPFGIIIDAAIMFDSPPYAGAGDLEFRYGNHISATFDSPNSITLTGTLSMRGRLPEINGMRVVSSTIGVGTTHTTQYRGGVYQGGASLAAPSSATLIVDLGQTTGTATNQYHSLAAPTGTSYLTSGAIINPIWKNNDGGIAVLFRFGTDPDPDYQPNDWSAGAEYETFSIASGGGMDPDETVSYEQSYLTGTNDTRPGNYPRFYLDLRVDGFRFAEGGADPTGSSNINLASTIFSSTFTFNNSTFILGTSSLASTIFSSTFTFNNSTLIPATASLVSNIFSSTFSFNNTNLILGTSSLASTITSSTFNFNNSALTLGTSSLASTIFSSTFTFNNTNITLGTASLVSTIFSSTFIFENSSVFTGSNINLSSSIFSSIFTFSNSSIINDYSLSSSLFSSSYLFQNNSSISSDIILYSSLLTFTFNFLSNPNISSIRRIKGGSSSTTTKEEKVAPHNLKERISISVKLRAGNQTFNNKVEMITEKREVKVITKIKN